MLELILATGNTHKAAELNALLSGENVRLLTAADLENPPDVEEDRPTLRGNAEKKAKAWYHRYQKPVLADDTGLEVDALDGAPGVHSARFAGPTATDAENRAHLKEKMRGHTVPDAQFRTVLAFVDENGTRFFEGVCRGEIIPEERGEHGFGYDALFVPKGYTHSFAELAPQEKNRISHRGRALRKFVAYLKSHRLAEN